jgi:hypothetical protein
MSGALAVQKITQRAMRHLATREHSKKRVAAAIKYFVSRLRRISEMRSDTDQLVWLIIGAAEVCDLFHHRVRRRYLRNHIEEWAVRFSAEDFAKLRKSTPEAAFAKNYRPNQGTMIFVEFVVTKTRILEQTIQMAPPVKYVPFKCARCADPDYCAHALCSKCKRAFYCDRLCQELDWPEHRNYCTDSV